VLHTVWAPAADALKHPSTILIFAVFGNAIFLGVVSIKPALERSPERYPYQICIQTDYKPMIEVNRLHGNSAAHRDG
jgi:hypothetical protein